MYLSIFRDIHNYTYFPYKFINYWYTRVRTHIHRGVHSRTRIYAYINTEYVPVDLILGICDCVFVSVSMYAIQNIRMHVL